MLPHGICEICMKLGFFIINKLNENPVGANTLLVDFHHHRAAGAMKFMGGKVVNTQS